MKFNDDPESPQVAQLSPQSVADRFMRFTYASGDQPLEGYTIKRGIGCGGFGEVYYATSDGGKEVALKLVQRHLDVELRGVTQCLNLKNPHLVILYDIKQTESGDCWVVMEYIAGETLADLVIRSAQGLPEVEVLRYLRGICDAVGYLHEQGIVHRDLKPGNIFIENGIVKIGDYGLAKFMSASRRSCQTESVGTVHYMAPELSKGRYGKEIDLYAVGIILFEMLTGQVPFEGQSPGEILMKHLTAQPDLNVLPPLYRPVVARLLAKEPGERYETIQAMLSDLDSHLAGRAPVDAPAEHEAGSGPPGPPLIPPWRHAISLPFWLDNVYGGLAGAEGMVRLDDDSLVLQFHVKDSFVGVLKTGLKEVRIPFCEIVVISLEEGWFSTKILIRASGMQFLSEVPESNRGQVKLNLARTDRATGRVFVSEAMSRVRMPQGKPVPLAPARENAAAFREAGPRRLVRPTRDRSWAGVCSGIAAYCEIDPVWIRIPFVALAFFTGFVPVLFVYLLLVFIIPEAGPSELVGQPWRAPRPPRGQALKIFLRFPVALFLGGGVGLVTGGVLHGVGGVWANEVAALLGVGAGLFTSGILFYLLCRSLEGRHRFWPGLAALMIGGGVGLSTAGSIPHIATFVPHLVGLPSEFVQAFGGVGCGLLAAGLAGFLMFASLGVPLRWRWMFVVLFLGGGAGFLTGAVGMALVAPEFLAALVSVGTGFLTTGSLIYLLTFGRLSKRLKLAGANGSIDLAGAGSASDLNRTQTWYAQTIPPWGWLRARPAILGTCVLLVVVAVMAGGASTAFWLQPNVRRPFAVSSVPAAPLVVDWELYRFSAKRGNVSTVVFSPDGKSLAFSSNDGIVELWDVVEHTKLKELKGHNRQVHAIVFNRDGTRVAAAADCRDVRVWNVASGEEICKSIDHPGSVYAAAFSPDGSKLATGGSDDVVRLLDASTGQEIRQFFGCKSEVHAVAFSPDGSRLAAVSEAEGIAHLWETSSSRQVRTFGSHEYGRKLLLFTPDGSQLALGNMHGAVQLWDVASNRAARRLTGTQSMTNSMAISSDGGLLAIGGLQDIELWDIAQARRVCRFTHGPGQFGQYQSVSFSPDGSLLASGGEDGIVRLWEIPELLRRSPPNFDATFAPEIAVEAFESSQE